MRNIVIYRHQLFKSSEGFIFDQTRYLSHHRPIFAGRKIDGPLPNNHLAIKTIQPCSKLALARHVILRDSHFLSHALRSENPAFIHAHFGVEGLYAVPIAKRLNIPLITTFHGFDVTTNHKGLLLSRKISWLNYLVFRNQLINHGRLFIAVSHFVREKLLQLHFPEQQIITHYIGIDTDRIKPAAEVKKTRSILHVARLVEVKGTRYLLEAFSKIHKHHADVNLIIIGDGPLRLSLQHYAKALGIAPQVQFLGSLPHQQVIEHMQQASIFCLPSQTTAFGHTEALGLVLLEASACGVPIVGTRHGGIPEAVKDNETGFLVPERNASALAERLSFLLLNEPLAADMGKAGRAFVEECFDLKVQTGTLERIYSDYL